MGRNARWIVLGALAVLAACGGTTATTGPGDATAGPGATVDSAQGTSAPATAGPVATLAGGGGTYNGKVCDLLAANEIEGVMDVTGVTGQETSIISDSGACLYTTGGGDIAVALSFTGGATGAMVWETWKSQAEAVIVPGIGDGAVFLPSAETMFLLKGGSLVGIQAGTGSAGPDARKAWEEELARFIAGRL